MFVQRTTSKRDNKTYYCYLVRESFRTEKGPRARTVANITGLPEEVRDVISQMLKGKQVVAVDDFELKSTLDYGGVAVLQDAWKRYGMDALLVDVYSIRHRGLLKALVFSRLLFPSSKHGLCDKARGTLLSAACGLDLDETFDEDDLYAAMDDMNGRWVRLEKQLFQKNPIQPLSLVLYDLTSVYFEGRGPEHLARYGYSRDHRGDRRQVLLAVATDADGVPLHLEVLKGNRGDTKTLKGLLETLKRRFGINDLESVVFSFDGGMASRVNLEAMEAERLRYVTRLSKSQLGSLMKQLPEDREPELFDHTDLFEIDHEGKRYVIAGGSMRRERDRLRREVRIKKAETELEALSLVERSQVDPQKLSSQLGRMLQRKKAHKYFHYHVDDDGKIHYGRKQEVIDAEAHLDGWYLLKTNLPIEDADTAEVLSHYKKLIEVEAAFRELKSFLDVRPIYHYRTDRVRNHIRICFLAYWMSAQLSREWKALGESRRVTGLLRSFQKIRVGTIELYGKPVKTLFNKIPPEMNKTMGQLNLLSLFSKPPAWATM